MQQRAGVSRHRELTKGLGNRESGPKRRHAFWWASDRLSIFLALSPLLSSSLSSPHQVVVAQWDTYHSYPAHLVTKPLYLRRRADYNNLFAPSGAGLTGLSNETSVLLLVKRNVFPRTSWSALLTERILYIYVLLYLVHICIVIFKIRNDCFPLLEFNHIFMLLNITNIHN